MTDKRQLRLIISAILQSKKIDDLALECNLVDAVIKFTDDTKKGKDPVKARQSIVDGILEYSDKFRKYEIMASRIEQALRVKPDGGDTWNVVIEHCIKKEAEGQSVEKYGEWMINDPFNSPKLHQIVLNPRLIIGTWPAAFSDAPVPNNPRYQKKFTIVPKSETVFAEGE